MKRLNLTLAMVLIGTSLAFAAGLISKQTAEKDALKAVGGGSVLQATLDSNGGKKVWSVDIAGSMHEYEVWVDAHSGAILKIIAQPPAAQSALISQAQAEQEALAAVSGGEVLQARLDSFVKNDRKTWSVDILGSAHEHEVTVDAHTGTVLKIVSQPLEALAPCTFITKAKAEKIAMAAVGRGRVLRAVLDKTDTPVNWSVDVAHNNGSEYEVKVNACTGKVIAIIIGG